RRELGRLIVPVAIRARPLLPAPAKAFTELVVTALDTPLPALAAPPHAASASASPDAGAAPAADPSLCGDRPFPQIPLTAPPARSRASFLPALSLKLRTVRLVSHRGQPGNAAHPVRAVP